MNRTHRIVWNRRRNCFMVVAENASSRGKSSGPAGALLASVLAGVMLGGTAQAADPGASALPSGAVVTAGAAQIGQNGATMTVTQASGKAAIEWNSFSIGKNATVNFVQPNAAAVALNRVKGTEGSVIDGALNANGQVFILNPNGVLFGKGARVDTAGLVASTLNLSDADFMAGKTTFSGKGGAVRNLGSLQAKEGGYIALLGAHVSNEGHISARLGTVALAAGNKVSLTFDNDALLGVVVDEAALAALVANGDAIHADGGLVVLTAKSAEGLLGTVVNNSGEVRARTIEQRGGRIFLLGEGGAVDVGGQLDASAPQGGNGGFIETSGPALRVAAGARVGTAAAAGSNGNWLIDPTDFAIDAGAAAQGASGMGAATLQTALAAGNVTIQTAAAGSQAGDINVNAPVAWSANKLTLEAHGNINVNAVMGATGTSTLDMRTGYNFNAGSPAFNVSKNVLVGIDAAGVFKGRIDFDRAGAGILSVNNVGYTLINALGNPGSTTSLDLQGINGGSSGRYALAGDINASATSAWNTGAGLTPISLSGVFDGLGHTVSGLSINQPAGSYVGLFGTNNGTVRNVALANATITANQGVGSLIGLNMGSVYNSYASAVVSGPGGYVGGLIGAIFDGTVNNLHVSGSVTSAGNNVGGLTGYLAYQINLSNSYATNTVTNSAGVWTGGLVGQNDYGRVIDSYATGTVSGKGDTGGLVGNNNSGVVSGSYATGTVTGTTNAGGLVGNNNNGKVTRSYATGAVSGTSTVGGLIGLSSASGGVPTPDNEINTSYATGAVNATADSVGGLIGRNSGNHVLNAYARGAVNTNGNYVGGLIGNNLGTADKTYSTGAVTSGGVGVGGLMGVSIGGVSNSFWDTQTSGQNSSGDGVGRTTAQMKDTLTFSNNNWDFTFHSGVWGRKNTLNGGYPVLRAFGYTDAITITLDNPALARGYGGANPALGGSGWTVSGCDNNLACITGVNWGSALIATTPLGNYAYSGANVLVPTLGAAYGKLSDYEITYAPGAIDITRAMLTLSGTSVAGKAYDRTNAATITAGTLSGMVNGENLSLSASGSFDSANAGQRTVTATFVLANGSGPNAGLASNYELTVPPPANLTATISPLAVRVAGQGSKIYDGNANIDAGLLQLTNVLPGDSVSISGAATLAARDAGVQPIIGLSGATLNNMNYTLAGATVGAGALITPRVLSLTGMDGAARAYDGTATAAAGLLNVGGVLGGDSAILSGSAQLAGKDAGTQAISGIGSLSLSNGNYTLAGASVTGTVAVTARPVALAARPQASRQYDGSLAADASLLQVSNAVAGEQLTLSGNATLASKDVGSQSFASPGTLALANPNYTLTGASVTGTVAVTARPVTLAARPQASRQYDGSAVADASLLQVANAVAGEQLTLSGNATLASKDAGSQSFASPGTLALANPNYILAGATPTGSVLVTQRAVQVTTVPGATRGYDGGASVASSLLTVGGLLPGDSAALGGSAQLAGKDVGNQAIVGWSGLSLNNGNYIVNGAASGGSVAITARPLGLELVGGATRVYDGSAVIGAGLLRVNGALEGDQVALSGNATLAGKDVGQRPVAAIDGLALDNVNYVLSGAPGGTVAVTARPLGVSALAGASRVYDGGVAVAPSLLQLSGVLDGDSAVLGGSAQLAAKDAGNQALAGLSGLTLSNSNYTLAGATPSGTVAVRQRPVAIAVASGASRVFDGSAAAAADLLQLGGLIPGDSVALGGSATLSGVLGRTTIAGLAGLTLSDSNYTLAGATVSGTVDISQIQSIAEVQRLEVPNRSDVLGELGLPDKPDLAEFTPRPPNVTQGVGGNLQRFSASVGANAPLSLVSSPDEEEDTEAVTLEQAGRMVAPTGGPGGQGAGGQREVRVPVSRNSLAEIVNGGVRLPGGVDQLLFVVKAQ